MGVRLCCWQEETGTNETGEVQSGPRPIKSSSPLASIYNDKVMLPQLKSLYKQVLTEGPKSLEEINLTDCELTESFCEHLSLLLSEVPNLTELVLENTQISSEHCKKLSNGLNKVKTLRSLVISNNPIGEDGFEELAPLLSELTQLKSLVLCGNQLTRHSMDKLATVIPNLGSLRYIDLRENDLGHRGVTKIVQALTALPRMKEFFFDKEDFEISLIESFQELLPDVSFDS